MDLHVDIRTAVEGSGARGAGAEGAPGDGAADGAAGRGVAAESSAAGGRVSLRARLERALREAVREGRLAPGTRLPSTRALCEQLGVSRGVVVDAYAQLAAEGYLSTRHGGGTVVAHTSPAPDGAARPAERQMAVRYDLNPFRPALSGFPRRAWGAAVGRVLRSVPDEQLGYPDPAGAERLRVTLAAYLGRVRGVSASPERILVTGGLRQGMDVLWATLAAGGARRVGVEQPGWRGVAETVSEAGLQPVPLRVDEQGLVTEELSGAEPGCEAPDEGEPERGALDGGEPGREALDDGAAGREAPDDGAAGRGALDAVAVAPAHQYPTGAVMSAARRTALIEWARRSGALVVEDDYDAEYRYDRHPVGALQGLDPERVVYGGSTSKTLAPAVRLGWLVLPRPLCQAVAERQRRRGAMPAALHQLALADLIERGELDRHLRRQRRAYSRRRALLLGELSAQLPGLAVSGAAAGLYVCVKLPDGVSERSLLDAALGRGIALEVGGGENPAMVLGYANLPDAAVGPAVRALADALAEARRAS